MSASTKQTKSIRATGVILCSLLWMSCQSETQIAQICAQEVPLLEGDVERARLALAPMLQPAEDPFATGATALAQGTLQPESSRQPASFTPLGEAGLNTNLSDDQNNASATPGARKKRKKKPDPVYLPIEDREVWTDWAENRLHIAQEWGDEAGIRPALRPVRPLLSRLANAIVVFHGYAQRGDVQAMTSTLVKIESETQAAKELLCQKKP